MRAIASMAIKPELPRQTPGGASCGCAPSTDKFRGCGLQALNGIDSKILHQSVSYTPSTLHSGFSRFSGIAIEAS